MNKSKESEKFHIKHDESLKLSEETEKIHTVEKPEKPKDIDELKKELLSHEITDSETVSLGLNRKQFFIRIPTHMTDRLNLRKEDKIRIVLSGPPDNVVIKLEVVRHGRA
ncbi:Uncharacterised protein [uncultured archaeon]|nr:Uncharacterised protein [uncultured archaeon]